MLMDFKVFISAESIELLDRCVEKQKIWHFDAINMPMLISELIFADKSYLGEYLYQEGVEEQDFEAFLPYYLSMRQQELEIKEGDEGKFRTQEQSSKVSDNHVSADEETVVETNSNSEEFNSEKDDENLKNDISNIDLDFSKNDYIELYDIKKLLDVPKYHIAKFKIRFLDFINLSNFFYKALDSAISKFEAY